VFSQSTMKVVFKSWWVCEAKGCIWDWVRRLYGWSFYYCSYWTLLLSCCYFTSDPPLTLWPFFLHLENEGSSAVQVQVQVQCSAARPATLVGFLTFWNFSFFILLVLLFYYVFSHWWCCPKWFWTFSHFIPISHLYITIVFSCKKR